MKIQNSKGIYMTKSWRQTPEQRGKKKQLCRESCLERSYPCGTLRNRPLKRKNKENDNYAGMLADSASGLFGHPPSSAPYAQWVEGGSAAPAVIFTSSLRASMGGDTFGGSPW